MTSEDERPIVFLSYASPDRDRVLNFDDYLTAEGFNTWIDVRRLKAGQNWDFEIRRALDVASVVVIFISNKSVDKRGYIQREIRIALHKLEEKLPEDIYVVPVRIDEDAKIPSQLRDIQFVTGEDDICKAQIADAIRHAIEQQGIQTAKVQENAQISWLLQRYADEWEGLPGYNLSFDWYALRSEFYRKIPEISDIIKGRLLELAGGWRRVRFEQNSDFYDFGEDKFRRQNSWEATCSPPVVQGRVISFQYSIWWYGAKAAHPNFGFITFSFLIDPPVSISLRSIFSDPNEALPVLQREIRDSLTGPSGEKDPEYPLDPDWVERGTSDWSDIDAFTFGDTSINFFFGAYSVAPYAWGPQFASVPYKKIAALVRREFRSALDIYYSESSQPEGIG